MECVIKRIEDTSFTYEDIIALLHLAFQERLDQGLEFTTSRMSVDEIRRRSTSGILLVAYSQETKELLGTGMIHLIKDENGFLYANEEYKGVHPSVKRLGIGSRLEEHLQRIAAAEGAAYIISDTAVRARSSVLFHLHHGFYRWMLVSYSSTAYYSIVFRKDIPLQRKKASVLAHAFPFCCSCIWTILTKKKNGSFRRWVGLFR